MAHFIFPTVMRLLWTVVMTIYTYIPA